MTTKEFYKAEDYRLEWMYEDEKVKNTFNNIYLLPIKKRALKRTNRRAVARQLGNISSK